MKLKIVLLVTIVILVIPILNVQSQISYEINREKTILDIQSSGEVLLRYNLTLTVISGRISHYVSIGMPISSFSIYLAKEVFPNGKTVNIRYNEVREGSYYGVKLIPSEPINAGDSRTYIVEAKLNGFIYEDKTNPGNVGLEFIPSWFNAKISELEVFAILPPGVSKSEIKNQPDYDNIGKLNNGRVYLYWIRKNLPPNYRFKIGISFPKKYVKSTAPSESYDISDFVIGLIFLGSIMIALWSFIKLVKSWMEKIPYQAPEIFAESLGPNKKMRPAEVAYLKKLEGRKIGYGRILAVIISSLVHMGIIAVKSFDPLRIEKLKAKPNATLRVYERKFLSCIKESKLDERCLVEVIKLLHKRLERELSGYSRKETLHFYDDLVDSIWRKVYEAYSSQDKLEIVKENLMWLLTDENFEKKLKRALKHRAKGAEVGGGGMIVPYPPDIWIWLPGPWPTIPPTGPVSTSPSVPKVNVPGVSNIEKAADSIARSVEKVSSGVVKNIEEFSNRVAQAIVPSGSGRVSPVSCACVSCACACACVSCACACAGGGVG